MKYCVKCNKQISDDSRFCNQCGSAAVDQLPAEVEQKTGVSLLAHYLQRNPEILEDTSRLSSLLSDVFPGEEVRCQILNEVFSLVGADLQKYSNFNEASAQQLGQLVANKKVRPEFASRQAVLDWAYVLGKCSLAEAQQWCIVATDATFSTPVASNVASSSLQASKSTNLSRFASCRPGDYIQFGRYPQNNGDTPEPIDWLVLARESNSLLVISKYALDCKPYNEEFDKVTWEQCTLRKWLNSDFMNAAFSDDEQTALQVSHLRNVNNPEYGTNGGNDTDDKLFLLSIDEAGQYLAHGSQCSKSEYYYNCSNNSDLKVVATSYAIGNGAYKDSNGNSWFWLRSPGYDDTYAAFVPDDGDVYVHGDIVGYVYFAVRPALRIILPS